MASVRFFDFDSYFMSRFNEGERDENGEWKDGGIGVFEPGEYFEVVEHDEFITELSALLEKNDAKVGDYVFVPYAERIENCFGIVLENNQVSFCEYGWWGPYDCKKTLAVLKKHNIKYKEFYTAMKQNKRYGEEFFMWETETMVAEMKEAGVWD